MLLDASTRGRKTPSPEQWWRLAKVVTIARTRGFRLAPPTAVDPTAIPAPARVNWGAWVADCPNPDCGGAEDIWLAYPIFFCMTCGNSMAGGVWIPVALPEDPNLVDLKLSLRPRIEDRNWEPEVE